MRLGFRTLPELRLPLLRAFMSLREFLREGAAKVLMDLLLGLRLHKGSGKTASRDCQAYRIGLRVWGTVCLGRALLSLRDEKAGGRRVRVGSSGRGS